MTHNKTKQLLNNSIETNNQEDNVQNPKQRYSLNNETTKQETNNQHKEDNALRLDENILNKSNERIIYNESDKELERNNNNESDTRSRANVKNIIQSYKDKEKQKVDRPMSLTTKHDNKESVSKDINTRKRNSKETNNSTNKVANPTREQEVKIQKSIHTPMIRNNYTMMNIIC